MPELWVFIVVASVIFLVVSLATRDLPYAVIHLGLGLIGISFGLLPSMFWPGLVIVWAGLWWNRKRTPV
jgi:hypothetical protein